MKSLKVYMGLGLAILLSFALGSSRPQQETGSGLGGLSSQEVRQIAKEAYIYGFPLVTNYETLHKQAVRYDRAPTTTEHRSTRFRAWRT